MFDLRRWLITKLFPSTLLKKFLTLLVFEILLVDLFNRGSLSPALPYMTMLQQGRTNTFMDVFSYFAFYDNNTKFWWWQKVFFLPFELYKYMGIRSLIMYEMLHNLSLITSTVNQHFQSFWWICAQIPFDNFLICRSICDSGCQ